MPESNPTTTIVVGVDDSVAARTALRWAAERAARRRAEGGATRTVIVTAWTPPLGLSAIFDDAHFETTALALLDALADELGEVGIEKRAVRGGSAAGLLAEAAGLDADLIVVGSRGHGGLAQVLLGSVSRHVAARADRPVAVVPHPTEAGGSSTVVAYDDSPAARAALRWTLEHEPGPIKVVSAWSLPTSAIHDPTDPAAVAMEQATADALAAGLNAACAGAVDERIEAIVAHGDPRLVILDYGREAAQIVIGQHGHDGLTGILLGSTVTYVAAHATKPVVIVPADGADRRETP